MPFTCYLRWSSNVICIMTLRKFRVIGAFYILRKLVPGAKASVLQKMSAVTGMQTHYKEAGGRGIVNSRWKEEAIEEQKRQGNISQVLQETMSVQRCCFFCLFFWMKTDAGELLCLLIMWRGKYSWYFKRYLLRGAGCSLTWLLQKTFGWSCSISS